MSPVAATCVVETDLNAVGEVTALRVSDVTPDYKPFGLFTSPGRKRLFGTNVHIGYKNTTSCP